MCLLVLLVYCSTWYSDCDMSLKPRSEFCSEFRISRKLGALAALRVPYMLVNQHFWTNTIYLGAAAQETRKPRINPVTRSIYRPAEISASHPLNNAILHSLPLPRPTSRRLAMELSASIDDSRRFSLVTSDDHAGQLWIVTILSLIYTGLVALARAYIKYQMYGFDDVLFALATVRVPPKMDRTLQWCWEYNCNLGLSSSSIDCHLYWSERRPG